jgi:hypothetical protein
MTAPAAGLTGKALGEAVLDVIESYPEKHDQGSVVFDWGEECGTTACIAGWTIALHLGLGPDTLSDDKVTGALNTRRGTASVWATELLFGERISPDTGLLGGVWGEFYDRVYTAPAERAIPAFRQMLNRYGT